MLPALLIENGDVYTPYPAGVTSILVIGEQIISLSQKIEAGQFEKLGFDLKIIDAHDCYVTPGIVDCHQHFTGGSGERGYATQPPEITLIEQISGGITTAVGCLGVDTCTRNMHSLLGRAKGFNEERMTAFIYTGGYSVPPATLTGSVRDDLILVQEVIGAGEVAISDMRSSEPSILELARIVKEAYVGGMLTKKAGVTHIHVGPDSGRIKLIRDLMNDHGICSQTLYPTHMSRSKALMEEGIAFTKVGGMIDLDCEDQDVLQWLNYYFEHGGTKESISLSSDASLVSPATLFAQVRECVMEGKIPLEVMLPMVTTNPSQKLKLHQKGRLSAGKDADILVIKKNDFHVRDVISRGRIMMENREIKVVPESLHRSNRRIELYGKKSKSP